MSLRDEEVENVLNCRGDDDVYITKANQGQQVMGDLLMVNDDQ